MPVGGHKRITRLEALLRAAIPWIRSGSNHPLCVAKASEVCDDATSYFEEKHDANTDQLHL